MAYDGTIRVDSSIDGKGFDKGINAMSGAVKKLGVAMAAVFAAGQIINFVNESVTAASTLQSAFVGLQSIVEGNGKSFDQAKAFIQEYAKDGLIPASEAATAYKNLISRGYTSKQAEESLIRLKDSAAFGRQAALSMGQAIMGATEGLKNENSVLVDNAGVTKNVSIMWADYAKSIGTTADKLTKQQKIQAEVAGIMQETKFQVGDAAKYTQTYAGQQAVLAANFLKLRQAVGQAFIPILSAIMPTLNTVIAGLTELFNVFGAVTSLIFGKQAEIASTANDAAKGQDNLANSTKGATKAAKGALAAFDDLNVLQKESTGGGGAGAKANPVKVETKDTKPLLDLNNIDFGPFKTSIEALKESFGKLKNSVISIWTDPDFQKLITWAKTRAITFGIDALNFSALALAGTLDMVYGSAKFLVGLFTGDWNMELEGANQTTKGLGETIEALSVALLGTNTTENIKAFFRDVQAGYAIGWEQIVNWWNSSAIGIWWTNDVAPWFTAEKWMQLWVTAKNGVIAGWNDIVAWWQSGAMIIWWNNSVAPWFTAKKWTDIWINVKSGISSGWKTITEWWKESALKKLWDDHIAPWFTKEKWQKLLSTVYTEFTTTFKNIGDAIKDGIKDAINAAIRLINMGITAINKLNIPLPGGGSVGFNISPVPYLANGAVLQPNKPFMAMVGDQRSGVNIETPLATMIDAFKSALSEIGGGSNGQPIALYLDGTKLGEAMLPKLNQAQKRKGVNLVLGTV